MESDAELPGLAETNQYQACLDYIMEYWPRITRLQTADDGT